MADQWACATQSDPAAGARAVRGEKDGAEIEALLPYRADSRDFLRPVRFSNFQIPQDPRSTGRFVRQKDPFPQVSQGTRHVNTLDGNLKPPDGHLNGPRQLKNEFPP